MNKLFSWVNNCITKYTSNYKGLPKDCWGAIYLSLINAISIGVCFFLSLYFVETLKFTMFQVGLLMSAYGIGTAMGGIIGGRLCDTFKPTLVVSISLSFQGFLFLILSNVHTIYYLMLNMLILGISFYTFKTANNVSLLQLCDNDHDLRFKGLGLLYAASNLGLGISGVLIGFIAFYGYKRIFYIAATLLIGSSFYSIFFYKWSNLINRNSNPAQIERESFVKLNKNDKLILILILLFLFFVGIIISQLSCTYPIYIKKSFPLFGNSAVGILFILDTVLIVLFQAPLAAYISKFNSLKVLGVGAFSMGFGMLILSTTYSFIFAILSCCFWTMGEMLFLPIAQNICYEKSDDLKKGQNIGYFQSTYVISTVIGPLLGGYVYTEISANAMWYFSFIIGITCLLICLSLKDEVKNYNQFCNFLLILIQPLKNVASLEKIAFFIFNFLSISKNLLSCLRISLVVLTTSNLSDFEW